MSDMQSMMKFEYLPNEILIEFFQYFNAIDIFYSFDDLNYRFSNLIRNIPLHLDIEYIKHVKIVQFCNKILLNSQIKNQFISLKLSGEPTNDNIETLFSFVSLDEFSQLRSLTLIYLDYSIFPQILSVLPLLTDLHYFHFKGSLLEANTIRALLPAATVQTLSLSGLYDDVPRTNQFTSVVNLNIVRCCFTRLYALFKYSPNLQYISIDTLSHYWYSPTNNETRQIIEHIVHLKRLVINDCKIRFDVLEILLGHTPNLKLLQICVYYDIEMINASRWQHLITSSLPLLDIFKFEFYVEIDNDKKTILDKFQQFQSDFWHDQHHWYTELTLNENEVFIYTIPYISNKYEVTSHTKRYYNPSINNINTFKNVTDLTLFIEAITDTCQYCFRNVKSLELTNEFVNEHHTSPFLTTKHIECLKSIVNLCKLTHLDISSKCTINSSSVLLHLMQETPLLSSLRINKNTLFSLVINDKLCKYLNKSIKKLDITVSSSYTFLNFDEIVKVCQIFSNMKQFQCSVGYIDNFLLILDELSKLSHIETFYYKTPYRQRGDHWLQDQIAEPNSYSFTIQCGNRMYDDDYFDAHDPYLDQYIDDGYYGLFNNGEVLADYPFNAEQGIYTTSCLSQFPRLKYS